MTLTEHFHSRRSISVRQHKRRLDYPFVGRRSLSGWVDAAEYEIIATRTLADPQLLSETVW